MKQRCLNPKNHRYADYGGRGIKVCERWLDFENFRADMGERPEGTTLDRIDVDGDYEPGNVRWSTLKVQMRNLRNTAFVTYFGEQVALRELAERLGLAWDTLRRRIQSGWPQEQWSERPSRTKRFQVMPSKIAR